MPPDLALLSTLIGSNYACLELICIVPKVFEPLKFDCIYVKATPFNICQDIFEKVMFSQKFASAKFLKHEIRAKLLCFILIY